MSQGVNPIVELKVLDAEFIKEFGIPKFESVGAAAMDLRANVNHMGQLIQAGETALIPTGIAISLNNVSLVAKLYPRSSLGHKKGLVLGNGTGVVDSDYQGQVFVSLHNRSTEDYTIQRGERIAQMAIEIVVRPEFSVVEQFASETERGEGGFGSTGKQ